MKLRAARQGLIRVATPKGPRSRMMDPGMEFEWDDKDPVPAWAVVVPVPVAPAPVKPPAKP